MISSVGRDVITACAALRAGLRRPSEISYFTVPDDTGDESVPITGYPVRGYTEGFVLIGLWLRVARGCLEDLIRYGQLPAASDGEYWRKTGLALVTPLLDAERFEAPEDYGLDRIRERYGVELLRLLNLPIPPTLVWGVALGHGGTVAAVGQAAQAIEAGGLDRAIILAVDSYLDPLTLEWLSRRNRLKTADNAAGLIPGEAGACFLVESESASAERKARIQGYVLGAAGGVERNTFFTEEVNTGMELTNVISQVLPSDSRFAGDLYADLNGEAWRAYELACARVRLAGRVSEAARTILPCDSLGDIGAASGAVGVCMAVRSFVRGYALNGQALVVSSSEHGNVGAVLLGHA